MTLFEYIAVAASLLCSLAAARLLGGVSVVFRKGRRYWVHASWLCLTILLITLNWWLFWSYRDTTWDYGRFLIALLPLAILYVVATLLAPLDATQVESWQAHYFAIRGRLLALNIAYVVSIVTATVVLLGSPVWHPGRLLLVTSIALLSSGLVKETPALHGAIVIWFIIQNVAGAVLFSRPGSFGTPPW